MRTRNNFNIIGVNQIPITQSVSGGVFSVDDKRYAQQNGTWPYIVTVPPSIELLVVAGGGSGGGARDSQSGGGGAGGLLYGDEIPVVAGVVYTITIGAGGSASTDLGNVGSNSSAFGCTALGGGRGGRGIRYSHTVGGDGGSGGGGTGWESFLGGGTATQTNSGGAIGYGNNGASRSAGGGAGAAGGAAGVGIGGIGREYTQFTGAGFPEGWYASGGCAQNVTAQNGGGGAGGNLVAGQAGKVNSGGGGGGAYSNSGNLTLAGGAGGSGVVAFRYPSSFDAGSVTGDPIYTVSGGYRIYTFTSSGSITF